MIVPVLSPQSIPEPKKGSTLHDYPYAGPSRKCPHSWGINVTPSGLAHCIHRCVYCYARDAIYSDRRAHQVVYDNLPELVRRDLERIDLCPPISLSNTTDPCQDVPLVRSQVTRLVALLMEYGVTFTITTKGDPSFLLDIPGFAAYEPKFISLTVEGPPDILMLLSPGAPSFEARLASVRRLSHLGVRTAIRLDPVIVHVWKAVYGSAWLDQLDRLADDFAGAGARHVIGSTGRLSRHRLPGHESMFERSLRIVESLSPEVAREFVRDYSDPADTAQARLLCKAMRVEIHNLARRAVEARGLTYSTCQELPSEADSAGLPSCEGFAKPFARKGTDGRFHSIQDCTSNCFVKCAGMDCPPCGQPALTRRAPYQPSMLVLSRRSGTRGR